MLKLFHCVLQYWLSVHQIISDLYEEGAVSKTIVSLPDGDYVYEFLMFKKVKSTLLDFFCLCIFISW